MKKILMILVILTIITSLFSCSQQADEPENKTKDISEEFSENAPNQGQTETESVSNEPAKITPDLEERDFGGAQVNFLVMSEARVPTNYSMEIYAGEETGDIINDAVYIRNAFVEEKYNVKITETPSLNLPNDAKKSILAADGLYDVFMMSITDINPFMQNGSLVNLREAPHIDLNKPWWNQRINKDLAISGKLLFTTGDLNIMDNNATWVTLFNKKLFTDNGLDMPYKMVIDGKWTLDRLYEYSKLASADLNGDGIMDEFDRYGFISEYYNTYALMIASGGKITSVDGNGALQITVNQQRVFDALDKILPIQWDRNNVVQTEEYTSKYNNPWAEVNRVMFRDGRGLLYITGILSATLLRDMDNDFGIIPLPKYDETQEDYLTTIHNNNASTVSIPVSNQNLERTGFILEALSAESMYTLTPAYYDVTLSLKVSRDEESSKMLDIILDSVIFDAGDIYNIGGILETIKNLTKASSNEFASRYETIEGKVTKDLEKLIENFK